MITCALCGHQYKESEAACGGCILVAGCLMAKCPNCGYETTVKTSPFVGWLGSAWAELQKRSEKN